MQAAIEDRADNAGTLTARLALVLEGRGLLDAAGIDRARRACERSGERIDAVLIRLGLVSDSAVAAALAEALGLRLMGETDLPAEPVLEDLLPLAYLRRQRAIPIAAHEDRLVLAMADPLDRDAEGAIAFMTERPVVRMVAAERDLDAAFARVYGSHDRAERTPLIESSQHDEGEEDADRLRDLASEAPIVRLVERLIARAVEEEASDIHIEPAESAVHVRLRRDGVLSLAETLPITVRAAVASRIKIMARLNIAERRLPQDGRIRLAVRGRDIDLRVSTMPTLYGESVVLRILDRAALRLDLGMLGLGDDLLAGFRSLLQAPNGIVLVTGPTGSGKTTTLYAGLNALDRTEHKVLTVEDPVEYHLAGVNQIQVNPRIGLTFAAALRSILRQDPDIVMVGEIRDLETAEIAVQASLTGHLVLSTVHTNSAAATLTRLIDMGIERYLLASSLTGVLAQRLVRRPCLRCAVPRDLTPAMRVRLLADAKLGPETELRLLRPSGCPACRSTGFSGRTAISELLLVDDKVRDGIVGGASEREIEHAAEGAGMRSLYRDGLLAAFRGETTVEEVLQVTRIR
jgi:general secretion pathway protein E